MQVLRCPFCEGRGRKAAILAKIAVSDGHIELWCRKCRMPVLVEIRDGVARFICKDGPQGASVG